MQLLELLRVDRRRRAGHQVDGGGGLRERDHLADRRLARQERHHAVEAERDAAVRRRAVFERFEEEAEPGAASSSLMFSSRKIWRCMFVVVDSDAAAANLAAVQHEVVGLRAHLARRRSRASAMSSSIGLVNGWCIGAHRLSSASHSSSGKSTTQRNSN